MGKKKIQNPVAQGSLLTSFFSTKWSCCYAAFPRYSSENVARGLRTISESPAQVFFIVPASQNVLYDIRVQRKQKKNQF